MFAILPFSLDHSHNTNQVEDTGKPSINYKITLFFRIQYKHVDRLVDLQTPVLFSAIKLFFYHKTTKMPLKLWLKLIDLWVVADSLAQEQQQYEAYNVGALLSRHFCISTAVALLLFTVNTY